MRIWNQCLLLICALASLPTFAGDYGILFTRQINRVDNLYLLDSAENLRQITDNSSKDSTGQLSVDGQSIVFTSERVGWWKIWTLDLQNNQYHQLTDASAAEYAPDWSPNGQQIVFVSSRDGNAELYIINKDGSGLRNLTNNSTNDNLPDWAEDGFIYYSTEVDGLFQLAKIRPDGSEGQLLTADKGNKFMPQLSPNQQRLLYYSDVDGNMDIYIRNLKDDSTIRLTEDPLQDIRPRWSPDGKHIVFERGDKRRNQHIYVMRSDGSQVRQLTTDGYNYSPAFVANCIELCQF